MPSSTSPGILNTVLISNKITKKFVLLNYISLTLEEMSLLGYI